MSVPFCKDCRFYAPPRNQYKAGIHWPAACVHPSRVDLVTGEVSVHSCAAMREMWRDCGPDGTLYEPAPEAPPAPKRKWWGIK